MAVEFRDYYEVLGLTRGADEKAIRTAYRRLARQHHPDVNPGNAEAEQRFKEINEAYEVLSDPEKRAKYDELGARWREYDAWQRAQQQAGRPGASPGEWSDMFRQSESPGQSQYYSVNVDDLQDLFGNDRPYSDFFETFFVGRPGPQRARPGRTLETVVELDLGEIISGTRRVIELPTATGGTRRIEASIPAGVDDGTRIRLAGQGEPGEQGAPSGDLFLIVQIRPHPQFSRAGRSLHTIAMAPLSDMLLGGEIEVATPTGRVALKIPAHTNDGQVFRLRGQGLPSMSAAEPRGDLEVEVHVSLPQSLSAEQRNLVEALARLERDERSAESAA